MDGRQNAAVIHPDGVLVPGLWRSALSGVEPDTGRAHVLEGRQPRIGHPSGGITGHQRVLELVSLDDLYRVTAHIHVPRQAQTAGEAARCLTLDCAAGRSLQEGS